MLRKIAPLLMLCLLLTLFACGQPAVEPATVKPATGNATQATSIPTTPATTEPVTTAPKSGPTSPASEILGKWYAYDEGSYPDEYAPALTFKDDGTYHFLVNLLEGMGSMTGTYEVRDGVIKCAVTDKDFYGFRGDDITAFELSIGKSTLVYHGAAFGTNESETSFERKKA